MISEITEYEINGVTPGSAPLKNAYWKWFPAFVPVLLVLFAARGLTGWVLMWLLAAALMAGSKWVTVAGGHPVRHVSPLRLVAYLCLWPGLNFRQFCFEQAKRPRFSELLDALGTTLFGAMMIWSVLRILPTKNPLVIGWIGMIGIVSFLHFGLFHLLSILWCAIGFNAEPLMNNPLRSKSISEFWGTRWNKAFNDLMGPHVLMPLAKKVGTTFATLLVFLVSGLLHELVISVPARGGFGLPTSYFLAQGVGLLIERSRLGRRTGLGRGVRGWVFTVAVTAAPAGWLFGPIFIRNVILPMLRSIGAI